MSNHSTHLQDHHGIEQKTLKNSELLAYLQKYGKFDIHSFESRLFLPASPHFANELGITPHSGGPLGAYQYGVLRHLDHIEVSRDWEGALDGDSDAMGRVVKRVEQLRDTIKVGLINGDLNTNTPLGQTPASTNQKIRHFFDNIETYQQTHRQQIEALKTFSALDHGWGAIVHTEPRIVSTLQQIHIDRRPIIRGGDIELQRSGLSLAIANAEHDGRLKLSAGGILVVERTLGEEAAYRIRVPPGQQGFATLGLLLGEASARDLVRSGGLLASGADAIMVARRTADLLEQGNATAAQSEVNHALARSAGGWLGGSATAYLVGTSGFTPVALIAIDALLLSKAFDKSADVLDNRAIYHQTDKNGVAWEFTGRNWQRQAAIDRTADGVDNPTTNAVGATFEKSRELGAYASRAAVELALGKAPAPQDPFNLPAQPGDRRGLDNQNWQRDPQTEQWSRQIKVGVSGANDRGIYTSEIASTERAHELNQQALARIESNIAHGREGIAAAYLQGFAAQRMQDYLEVPAAVQAARARSDTVVGSDNQLYQRNTFGQWLHEGQPAHGNLALELELTRQIREPSLQQFEQTLARIQAQPPPTPEQMDQHELVHRYRSVGTQLNPEWQQAIVLATARTRQAHGLGAGTLQELHRDESGQLGAASPIVHYQIRSNGVAHPVATTSSEELRQAWNEIRTQRQQAAPQPDAPVMQITPVSPQQREAHEQTLREANRLNLSMHAAHPPDLPTQRIQNSHESAQVPAPPESHTPAGLWRAEQHGQRQHPEPTQKTSVPEAASFTAAVPVLPHLAQAPVPSQWPHVVGRSSSLPADQADAYQPLHMGRSDGQPAVAPAAPAQDSWEEIARSMYELRIQLERDLETENRIAQARQARVERGEQPFTELELRDGYDPQGPSAIRPPARTPARNAQQDGDQNDRPLPTRKTITGDPDVDDLLYAIDSKNDLAIEQALKRVANSAHTAALAEQGHAFLDARDLQEAQEQMNVCQTLGVEVSAEMQTRRGPVMVLTLPQFAQGPGMHGGPQGDDGGGGDGGGGGGG